METIKNVLLDDPIPDLLLEFDFKNISTKEYYYIVQTIRHSSSLLNDDLVHISKEMVERVKNDTFHGIDKNTVILFNMLYSILHTIPNTSYLIKEMKQYCPWLSHSPSISPVASPKIMEKMNGKQPINKKPKKMKKVKPLNNSPSFRSRTCLC
tara:strand:+ start:304 stop:762 length:459 start_codon:yes stop_codon:yes gene_type:complete